MRKPGVCPKLIPINLQNSYLPAKADGDRTCWSHGPWAIQVTFHGKAALKRLSSALLKLGHYSILWAPLGGRGFGCRGQEFGGTVAPKPAAFLQSIPAPRREGNHSAARAEGVTQFMGPAMPFKAWPLRSLVSSQKPGRQTMKFCFKW